MLPQQKENYTVSKIWFQGNAMSGITFNILYIYTGRLTQLATTLL